MSVVSLGYQPQTHEIYLPVGADVIALSQGNVGRLLDYMATSPSHPSVKFSRDREPRIHLEHAVSTQQRDRLGISIALRRGGFLRKGSFQVEYEVFLSSQKNIEILTGGRPLSPDHMGEYAFVKAAMVSFGVSNDIQYRIDGNREVGDRFDHASCVIQGVQMSVVFSAPDAAILALSQRTNTRMAAWGGDPGVASFDATVKMLMPPNEVAFPAFARGLLELFFIPS